MINKNSQYLIFSILCFCLFIFARSIARFLSDFYSRYPLVRLLPPSQFGLRPAFIRFGAIVIFLALPLYIWLNSH